MYCTSCGLLNLESANRRDEEWSKWIFAHKHLVLTKWTSRTTQLTLDLRRDCKGLWPIILLMPKWFDWKRTLVFSLLTQSNYQKYTVFQLSKKNPASNHTGPDYIRDLELVHQSVCCSKPATLKPSHQYILIPMWPNVWVGLGFVIISLAKCSFLDFENILNILYITAP